MKKALTDRLLLSVAGKAPAKGQAMIWDTVLPGFAARVSGKGKVAFIVMKRPAGAKMPLRVTLGHFPVLGLKAARDAARVALGELMEGKNPNRERKHRLAARAEENGNTFGAVVKEYAAHIAGARTQKHAMVLVNRELVTRWGSRPITDITRRDVIAMIDEIRNSTGRRGQRKLGGPAAARQALTYARAIFRYALARDLIQHSPADVLDLKKLIGPRKPRQRVLTDEELRRILTAFPWDTADGVEPQNRGRWPIAPALWLLALTGLRRGELTAATWDDVDLDRGTLLIQRNKAGDKHLVPLPAIAVRILRTLPRFNSRLIFTNGYGPVTLGSYVKREIDAASGVRGWVVHDVRRSARSGWSALGIPPHLCEMMLGHRQPGIIPTYDVYRYEDERRAALELWAKRIGQITAPPPPTGDNVVELLNRVA
jgi:integrase